MRDTKKTTEEIVKDVQASAIQAGLPAERWGKVEKALRPLVEREALYRDLIETCPVGIFRSTPDGKILFANRTIMDMFEYDAYPDYTHIDLVREEKDAGYPRKEFLMEIELNGVVRGLEATLITRNGTRVRVRENARAVKDADGTTLYYEGTMEDITPKRSLK